MQKYAVMRARQMGKPAIVAHQLLNSMIEYPIPTRAEVADVADVVRQRADALMLSGGCLVEHMPACSVSLGIGAHPGCSDGLSPLRSSPCMHAASIVGGGT